MRKCGSFLVVRYGDFVLLKPRFSRANAILWLAAPLLLVAGGVIAVIFIRRRPRAGEAAPLTGDEQARLDALLKD